MTLSLKKKWNGKSYRLILLIILAILLIRGIYSERILENNGLGFDGFLFSNFTENFSEHIKNKTIDIYYFQRIGVPAIIHGVFSSLNIVFTASSIISAYIITNLLFLLIGVIYFFRISKHLSLTKEIEVIGFASLFFCFPVLKLSMYYPILMDIPALSLSIILVYYFLKNNNFAFFIIILLGSFVYPTFILFSFLMFFKNTHTIISPSIPKEASLSLRNTIWHKINILHYLFCFTLPILLIYLFIENCLEFSFDTILLGFKYNFYKTLFMWISFFCSLAYLCYLNYFYKTIFSFKTIFTSINYINIILAAIVVLIVRYVLHKYAADKQGPLSLMNYLNNIILQAIKNPLNFIVAHVYYFGLAPLLLFFLLKDIKKEIVRLGFGMILFFNLTSFFSIGNESRILINYYPFLVLLLILVLQKYWSVSLVFSVMYSVICLALSHFWYSINAETKKGGLTLIESAKKHYFMFQGPWVSNYMYKIHLLVFLSLLILIWLIIKKTNFITRKKELDNN